MTGITKEYISVMADNIKMNYVSVNPDKPVFGHFNLHYLVNDYVPEFHLQESMSLLNDMVASGNYVITDSTDHFDEDESAKSLGEVIVSQVRQYVIHNIVTTLLNDEQFVMHCLEQKQKILSRFDEVSCREKVADILQNANRLPGGIKNEIAQLLHCLSSAEMSRFNSAVFYYMVNDGLAKFDDLGVKKEDLSFIESILRPAHWARILEKMEREVPGQKPVM